MASAGPTSSPGKPSADVSVRVAWADDAEAIARVQRDAWRTSYADLLPPDAVAVDPEQSAAIWRQVLTSPAEARTRVLVALERNRVVGYAITSPAVDPDCSPASDAELMEFTVDPGEQRVGHGSRLLQAAADTMVADRFGRAVLWAIASDDDLRAFLEGAGWAPDGAHRELDLDGEGTTVVKQVRLHTRLGDPS